MSARRPVLPDAASQKFDPAWLRQQLRSLVGPVRGRSLCVAFSGGMDSTALLCALSALRARDGFALRALHVNHQLQPLAAEWARQAQSTAGRLRVPCTVLTVSITRSRGESLEAAARAARYAALLEQMHSDELLLTAHHQEDQLETILLALMRGSGLRGLSAMGAARQLEHVQLLRPLLPIARVQLEHYLTRRGLAWTEDPSNQDERFDRNYLRRAVVPLLRVRWPAAAATASRSAAHLWDCRSLLDRVASRQLQDARDGRSLRASVLRRLPIDERMNVLRLWFAQQSLNAPDYARMREIAGPMLSARVDSTPSVRWQGVELRRHADGLHAFVWQEPGKTTPALEVERWRWRQQPWLSLGAAGSLELVPDPHGDLRLAALPAVLSVRYRLGGERLQGQQGHFKLKDLLQRQRLAPWVRSHVPLVVHERTVIAVADLWLAPEFTARAGPASGRARFRWRHSGSD